ncbi:hypothetical protein GGI07_000667 [Coemansia sp. Benny D115]|nr:hypothetical protein GGI07_000667 [Coemansia sp. Benny D115]
MDIGQDHGAGGGMALGQQVLQDGTGMGKFGLASGDYQQSLASAVAAGQQEPARSPAPVFPGASTIPTNFSSGQINSAEALQEFQRKFWAAHMASIEDNMPDFKLHLLPLARIKKVMKSDPDVKVQMISAEAPILFSKACEIFITEITQRAWMNAEENKRRTLQRQDVSFAAQKSEMFDFLIDVVPREEFASKKTSATVTVPSSTLPAAKEPSAEPTAAQAQAQAQEQAQAQAKSQEQAQQQQQVVAVQQVQQSPQQPQSASLYNDPAFQQYYAHQLVEAATGYPQTEQRQAAYYQQIEREQLQWLQRQANMPQVPQPPPQGQQGQEMKPGKPEAEYGK